MDTPPTAPEAESDWKTQWKTTFWRETLPGRLTILGFVLVALIAQRGHFSLTPDSYAYLSCAWHLRQGHGLVSSQLDARHTRDAEHPEARAFTQWPPLYPIQIALWNVVGVPLRIGAWMLAAWCTGLALWAAWGYVTALCAGRPPPWLVGLIATFPLALPFATNALADGLALYALVAVYGILDAMVADDCPEGVPPQLYRAHLTFPFWYLLWILNGIWLRYAFLAAVPAALIGYWFATRKDRRLVPRLALLLGGLALGITPLLARNMAETGRLDGAYLGPPVDTFFNLLKWRALQVFGPGMPDPEKWFALLGWLAIAALSFGVWKCLEDRVLKTRLLLLPIAAVLQLLGVVLAESRSARDPNVDRYFAPITILLLIFALASSHQLAVHWKAQGRARLAFALAWLVPLAIGGVHVRYLLDPILYPTPIKAPSLLAWLDAHAEPGTVYAGSGEVRFLLAGAPEHFFFLPLTYATGNSDEAWVDRPTLQWCTKRYGLRLLIFPTPVGQGEAVRYGPFMEQLMRGESIDPSIGELIARDGWRVIRLADPVGDPEPKAALVQGLR